MSQVKLLDCTLRDGAYLIDKEFGNNNIHGIIRGLVDANIDYVEIGFLQNDGFGEGKTVFSNSADAKKYIPEDKRGTLFAVLADYSRYDVSNLDECVPDSIDAVRECFFKYEINGALEACKGIKEKGYKLFVQPVDILGYNDLELIELIDRVNEIEPYCISIVDTFGSMYQEDLHRVFEIIDHNLTKTCKIGFHSHNNMQLSNALSQEFVRISSGRREVIIDGTLNGMGRGAGNTPTELIVQYLNTHLNSKYDMDSVLDVIDNYMNNIRTRCSWGFTTPYFVAGCYGAHVNNVQYLMKKNSIRSKDLRYILNEIGAESRKRYDYELLEKAYLSHLQSDIDDAKELEYLGGILRGKNVLILAPGETVKSEGEIVAEYICKEKPIIISVNYVDENIKSDYIYMSNVRRYDYWKNQNSFRHGEKILLSSIKRTADDNKEHVVSFSKVIKCGWDKYDNAMILLLRLLDYFNPRSVAIAGFDGYSKGNDYISSDLEVAAVHDNPTELNLEIKDMLDEYFANRRQKTPFFTITSSRFSECFPK